MEFLIKFILLSAVANIAIALTFSDCHCPTDSLCILTDRKTTITCLCPGKLRYNTVTKQCEDVSTTRSLKVVGCFKDEDYRRSTGSEGTPQKCVAYCKSLHYRYAGLEGGNQCRCGQTFGTHPQRNSSECNTPCTENPVFYCGGTGRTMIYRTGYKACNPNICKYGRKCVDTENGIWCSCLPGEVYNTVENKCQPFTTTSMTEIATKAFEALRTADYDKCSRFIRVHIDPIFDDVVRICSTSTDPSNYEECRIAEIVKTMKLVVNSPSQYSGFNDRVVVMTNEFQGLDLKDYLKELHDKSRARGLLYDLSQGLNTILRQNSEQFTRLGQYFEGVAKYDTDIAVQDRGYLEKALEALQSKSRAVGGEINFHMKRILTSAVAAATIEVAQRTLMLVAEIAMQMSNLCDVLPKPPDVNAIADRAGELAQAVVDLVAATKLFRGLEDLAKEARKLGIKFANNTRQTEVMQNLIDNLNGDISEDEISDFIKFYGDYSPAVTSYDIAVLAAKLEYVAETGCELFLGQTSVAAKTAEGINKWGRESCEVIGEKIAGLIALAEEIYDYQFDVVDTYAKIVKGKVATMLAVKLQHDKTQIDLNGVVQGMILDQGKIQKVATMVCNQMEYNSAGVRFNFCTHKYYTDDDIMKIYSAKSGLMKRKHSWSSTVFIPTSNNFKSGEINLPELLNRKNVSFTVPRGNHQWLVSQKWVKWRQDIQNNVYYIKSIEPMMPELSCARNTRFIVRTARETSIFDTDRSTSYGIDAKTFEFDYNHNTCSGTYIRRYAAYTGSQITSICAEKDSAPASPKIPTSLFNQRWTIQFLFTGCSQTEINTAISKVKRLPILISYNYLIIRDEENYGNLNFCYPNPCKNGGVCTKDTSKSTFKCSCRNGASGEICETSLDHCESKSCINGLCENTIGGAKCKCGPYEPYALQNKCLPNNCATSARACEKLRCGLQYCVGPNLGCTNTAYAGVCTCPTGQTYIADYHMCRWNNPCDSKPCGTSSIVYCTGTTPNTENYECKCIHNQQYFDAVTKTCKWS